MQSTQQLPATGHLPPETASRLITEAKSLLRQATTEPLHDMILKNLVNEVQHHYNSFVTSLQSQVYQLQTHNSHLSGEVNTLGNDICAQRSTVASLQNQIIQLQTHNAYLSNEAAKLEKQTIGQLSEALNKATTPAPPNPQAQYRGSTTRAKNWGAQILLPTTQLNRDTPSLTTLQWQANGMDAALVRRLTELSSDDEQDIDYPAVINTLAQLFVPQEALGLGTTHVLDTHERRYLNELAPDITIQRNTCSADRFNAAAVIDLKGAAGKLGSPTNLGQIFDYLMELVGCQPGRRVFLGMLTDLRDGIIVKYTIGATRGQHRRRSQDSGSYTGHLIQYRKTSLDVALRHLFHELTDETANPPHLPFTPGAGELVHVLQRHSNAVVAVYRHKGVNRIVKAPPKPESVGAISSEIAFLRRLQGPSKPKSIPELVYVHDPPYPALPEFGITPAGQPIHLELFKTPGEFRASLEDILDALRWVHEHGLVHRDVRTDNIVVFRDWTDNPGNPGQSRCRGLLIDFDRATEIGKECHYEGGYISCPMELLENVRNIFTGSSVRSYSGSSADFLRENSIDMDMQGLHGAVEEASGQPESGLSTLLYRPRKAHDYLAFVLLVNTLIFPFALRWYSYNRVVKANSEEHKRLVRLWDGLKQSHAWSGMVSLAESEETDITRWRKWLELIVWL
ncbi:hypothetical protein L211DRAFT_871689 [Terfezia boudieri ATCC MYA-4762]|uniref:non-specific serine/threonine protein kinase n=1 Tax=Terfezia boudieri ATCC MYA-4762 TaxID=1051890 RepID=A0A3N4L6V8_9PEZI|nr:hypothetical protein L211DRAFT_871689 [Terfezia boudieri ATCC MYA-4762]